VRVGRRSCTKLPALAWCARRHRRGESIRSIRRSQFRPILPDGLFERRIPINVGVALGLALSTECLAMLVQAIKSLGRSPRLHAIRNGKVFRNGGSCALARTFLSAFVSVFDYASV